MLPVETAVDYYPQTEPRFHVVYIVYSTLTHAYLNLRAPVNGEPAEIDTVETVYPSANWREREIWDLFGIRFDGSFRSAPHHDAAQLGRAPAAQRLSPGL